MQKFRSKFTAVFNPKVMYPPRTIFMLFLFLGMVFFGCTSNNQNRPGSSEATNLVDDTGLKQGHWDIYADSILISRGDYLDGLPDGLWTSWYKNGQMREEGHYIAGVKNGMWIEWYQDGEIMWKGEWKNGTRQIEHLEYKARISFVGQVPKDRILAADSLYHLQIRIENIPASNLFVEVSSGEITRNSDSGLFYLETPSDSMFTIAIGYMPDLDFPDFRNLISEFEFKIK